MLTVCPRVSSYRKVCGFLCDSTAAPTWSTQCGYTEQSYAPASPCSSQHTLCCHILKKKQSLIWAGAHLAGRIATTALTTKPQACSYEYCGIQQHSINCSLCTGPENNCLPCHHHKNHTQHQEGPHSRHAVRHTHTHITPAVAADQSCKQISQPAKNQS